MIKVENLIFHYPKSSNSVLDGISFECQDGKIYVLLGLNGSGKTTLIKLLAGLIKSCGGNIGYDGQSIENISIKERSKKLSYVSQKTHTIEDFIVSDYLLFGMVNKMNFYERPTQKHIDNVNAVAEQMGVTHLLNKKLGEISGGERQIVSIAASIIQDTPVILLDEPTSALDICNQNKVLSVLKSIAETQNKTIILSSHNPNHALFLQSQVILLNNGKIAANGSANDIITVEMLKAVYGENICYSEELPYKEVSFRK